MPTWISIFINIIYLGQYQNKSIREERDVCMSCRTLNYLFSSETSTHNVTWLSKTPFAFLPLLLQGQKGLFIMYSLEIRLGPEIEIIRRWKMYFYI